MIIYVDQIRLDEALEGRKMSKTWRRQMNRNVCSSDLKCLPKESDCANHYILVFGKCEIHRLAKPKYLYGSVNTLWWELFEPCTVRLQRPPPTDGGNLSYFNPRYCLSAVVKTVSKPDGVNNQILYLNTHKIRTSRMLSYTVSIVWAILTVFPSSWTSKYVWSSNVPVLQVSTRGSIQNTIGWRMALQYPSDIDW